MAKPSLGYIASARLVRLYSKTLPDSINKRQFRESMGPNRKETRDETGLQGGNIFKVHSAHGWKCHNKAHCLVKLIYGKEKDFQRRQ